MSKDAQSLALALGHEFTDKSLLRQALTHRSFSGDGGPDADNNERMEFLGDSVLGFVVSDVLFSKFPAYSEGQLTKLKAQLVSGDNLAVVGDRLELGSYLILGKGEESNGGRTKKGLIVDAVEALIAGVFLDAGIDAARRVVDSLILAGNAVEEAVENVERANYKPALQEWMQARKLDGPRYTVVNESGPPHNRTFTVEVEIGDEFRASAEGPSIKTAERNAAAKALRHFRSQEQLADSTECS